MKSRKNKRKFRELGDNSSFANSQNMNTQSSKVKSGKEYKTPLENLISLYPSLSSDLIEDIFIDNDRNFVTTKQALDEMCKNEEPLKEDNKIVDINSYDYSNNYNDKEKIDLTKFAKFEIDSDVNYNEQNVEEDIKELDINNDNNNKKMTKQSEYKTVFNVDKKIVTPIGEKGDLIIDDFLLDDYVKLLCEIFPNYTRKDIMKKICEMDFDVDKVVMSFFDYAPSQEELKTMENFEFTNKEEILSNFSSFDMYNNNKINIDAIEEHNLQKEIEEQIKKQSQENKNNYIQNSSNNEQEQEQEEYFLDKPISQIKTKEIRNDLTKLSKQFPFEDEFTLKWIYYQYMNYNQSYNYLSQKNKVSYGLKSIVDSIDQSKSSKPIEKPKQNYSYSNSNPEAKKRSRIISSIISENPSNWRFRKEDNVNIADYQSIRRQLIIQAQHAFASKRYQEANAIMAKARRYKQEINQLMERKKIATFMKNNEHLYNENLFNDNHHIVDLHGLSLEESKMVVSKKCRDLLEKKENEDINRITLCLITGRGSHSKDKIPVLLPGLTAWIKSKTRFKHKIDDYNGIIKIFL